MGAFIVVLVFSFLLFTILFVSLIWSVASGQLDDLNTPKERVLWEDPHDE